MRVRAALALIVLFAGTQPSLAQPQVRVGLYPEDRLPAKITVRGPLRVGEATLDTVVFAVRGGRVVALPAQASGIVSFRTPALIAAEGFRPVRSSGSLRVVARGKRLQGILTQSLEDYAARVTACEMPLGWHSEALAAQCVVARSFGAAGAGRHAGEGYDVCALTHCQLWSPTQPPGPAAAAAARTSRVVLRTGGRVASPPFASTCGGWTADGSAAGLAPWCRPLRDASADKAYCSASPHFRWSTLLTHRELRSVFGLKSGSGAVRLSIASRDSGGRVTSIAASAGETRRVKGSDFLLRCGRLLGWARVKSCLFEMKQEDGGWRLTGHGLGHGAGMCQWGAKTLAERGRTWTEILRFYYPAAQVARL